METKKILKPFLFIVILISIIAYFFSYIFAVTVVSVFSTDVMSKLITLSIYIVLISVVYIIYKYILLMINNIKEKKKIPSIIMIGITVLAIVVAILIKLQKSMSLIGITMSAIYFFGIIIIPLVMIGFAILGKSKSKSIKITKIVVAVILTIFIYVVNLPILYSFSKNIVNRMEVWAENSNGNEISDLEIRD